MFKVILGFVKQLVVNTIHSVSGTGTVVTVVEENTSSNPAGKFNPTGWHIYRMIVGGVLLILSIKGLLPAEDVPQWMSIFSM